MKKPEIIFDYLQFRLSSRKKHGIHSPFVFDFIESVLCDRTEYAAYSKAEDIRKDLLHCNEKLSHLDFGGNEEGILKEKIIRKIVKSSSKNQKNGRLLFRLSQKFKPPVILELGTSVGISTLYLASGNPAATVHTIEGCSNTAFVAKENFLKAGAKNIIQHTGKFDDVLPGLLESISPPELVFIDGNHYPGPTMKYFELCLNKKSEEMIFVFDDIRWSSQMKKLWKTLCLDQRITVSIDLFSMGILFLRNGQAKEHFRIRF